MATCDRVPGAEYALGGKQRLERCSLNGERGGLHFTIGKADPRLPVMAVIKRAEGQHFEVGEGDFVGEEG